MSKWLILLLPLLGGMAGGAQAPINGGLGRRIGIAEATFVSFAVGATAAGLIAAFAGRGALGQVVHVPRWMLVGGLLGMCYVGTIIAAVPRLGAASTIFAGIAGQLLFTVAADHFGWLGLERIPLGVERALGLALMVAGVYLVSRSR